MTPLASPPPPGSTLPRREARRPPRLVLAALLALLAAVGVVGAPSAWAANGTITGVVTDAQTGQPVPELWVSAAGTTWSGDGTDASGRFEIVVAPGTYRVVVATGAYGGATWADAKGNTSIVVADGATVTGINLGLNRTRAVTGTVTNGLGQPVDGILVAAYTHGDKAATPQIAAWSDEPTGADGRFRVPDLPAGDYALELRDTRWPTSAYATAWVGGGRDPVTAGRVTVRWGADTTGVSGRVQTAAAVTGTLRDDQGAPLRNFVVTLYDASDDVVTADIDNASDGTYRLSSLPPGTYTMRVWADGYTTLWYGQARSTDTRKAITVTSGQQLALPEMRLPRLGSIAGRVLTSTGASVPLKVTVTGLGRTVTEKVVGGYYTISDLEPTAYTVSFSQDTTGTPTFGAQWWRGASSPASAQPLTVAAGQSVTGVDATLRPGSTTVESSPPAVLTTATPTVTGTPRVGERLTAVPGTWGPAPVTLYYQWYRGQSAISGASASTYVASSADVGQPLSVVVTGRKTGYAEKSLRSAGSAAVDYGAMTVGSPTMAGSTRVGQRISAAPGTWGPAPVSLYYQWFRGASAISGATASSYVLTPSDLGQQVTVRVTGRKSGYRERSAYSWKTNPITAGLTVSATPTITGTRRVGYALRAEPGSWTWGMSFSYQWMRSGVAISRATGRDYRLTTSDRGRTVTVRVTGKRVGYTTVTRESASAGAIR